MTALTTRFLHTSDLQLGMTRWFLQETEDAQALFDAARVEAITRIGEKAIEYQCDFIIVAGDVFEHNSISTKTRERALAALAALPVDVYLLPGNHDPLTADSIFYRAESHPRIHVFTDNTPIEVAPGVELIGAPWHSKTPSCDLVSNAIADLEPAATIRIVVGHGQLDNRSNDIRMDIIDRDTVEAAIRGGTIDYLALGDTHSAMSLSDTGAIWFSGAPEVTAFRELPSGQGENNSGKALIVDIAKSAAAQAEVTVTETQIGTWRFDAISADVNSLDDVRDFITQLDAYPRKDRTVIKYSLVGAVDLATRQHLESELARLRPLFAHLYPRTRTMNLTTAATDVDIVDLDLSGFVLAAAQELATDTDPVASDALNLLFQLHNEV